MTYSFSLLVIRDVNRYQKWIHVVGVLANNANSGMTSLLALWRATKELCYKAVYDIRNSK